MATSYGASPVQAPREDPLSYLPCSAVQQYRKGAVIYSRTHPSANLSLVIDGKVKVSHLAGEGKEVVVDIYRADDFFGESAFLGIHHHAEEARALENSKVMTWTVAEIEEIVSRQPRLAVALLQVLAQRNVDLTERIESFSTDDISHRVARTLVRLSERMGAPEEGGRVRMGPLTHELLSQYVGTSREVVTLHMNRFRRQGCVRYSRKNLVLDRGAFQEFLGLVPQQQL